MGMAETIVQGDMLTASRLVTMVEDVSEKWIDSAIGTEWESI